MPDQPDARKRLLRTGGRLFRRQGYANTSIKQILDESGVVAGSLYHHFPGGKQDLAAIVLRGSGAVIADHLRTALTGAATPAHAIQAWISLLEQSMAGSDGLEGCPVAPVAAEAPMAGTAVRERSGRCRLRRLGRGDRRTPVRRRPPPADPSGDCRPVLDRRRTVARSYEWRPSGSANRPRVDTQTARGTRLVASR
ncbi:TetR/AcrR family transcriptional regulator [Fodinicola feengrottensis]|nr:TetR/AcrR family transcriptional regulator [Fodinicola feengrottensis]